MDCELVSVVFLLHCDGMLTLTAVLTIEQVENLDNV